MSMGLAPRAPAFTGLAVIVLGALLAARTQGTAAQPGGTRGSDLDRARQRIEGSFALEEWKVDGKILRPPQVEGWFSIHDGVVLFMTLRKDLPVHETVVGHGSYRFEGEGWTYGYSHLETIRADQQGSLSRTLRGPISTPLKLQWQGDLLLAIGQGADRREYSRESFISPLGAGGDYRKWRRAR